MRSIGRRLAIAATLAALMLAALAPVGSTAPSGYAHYPSKVRKAFVKGCVKGGASRAVCTCTINGIEKKYSLKQFVAIANKQQKTGKLPAAIGKIAKGCAASQQG
jgi:hypothetical protein